MRTVIFPVRATLLENLEDSYQQVRELYEVISDYEISQFAASGKRVIVNSLPVYHYVIGKDQLPAFLNDENHEEEARLFSHYLTPKRRNAPPKLMGIVNATPDSFYSGSRLSVNHMLLDSMLDAKPDIIDVGGESTRPGSLPVSPEIEQKRVKPVIDYISQVSNIPISLDSRNWKTVEAFIDQISYINDISGFTNERMITVASRSGASCIVMHMVGTPQTMMHNTKYDFLEYEIIQFLLERASVLERNGVSREKIILDPGIGFSKDSGENLRIIHNLNSFKVGFPLLVGTSRKSFIGRLTGKDPEQRLPGTIASALECARNGADILRVHDPLEIRDALLVQHAILNYAD
ncbi:dihydropteroate synthase [Thermoplasmatales archaeon AK]|nr:dihydropteroate synthase [Thermoplasmatales archaeon AK]